LLLVLPSLGSSNWSLVHEDSCHLNKSLSEIRQLVPSQEVWKLIHLCDKKEMEPFSRHSPRNMRWSPAVQTTRPLWYSIMERMKEKKLVLLGDSVMYQTLVGLMVYLDSIGIPCTPIGESGYKCGSGMEIHRPAYVARLNDEFVPLILPIIISADIAIVNVGLHYKNWPCKHPSNSRICDDVRAFFKMLTQKISKRETNVSLAWMDSFRPHFPSPNGAYLSWKRIKRTSKKNTTRLQRCRPISKKNSYQYSLYGASHVVAKEFPHIPVIPISDITFDRYDMHLGILTHSDAERLDCVHLCLQPCYWEAIAFRIGIVVDQFLVSSSAKEVLN
jgi:hypothetical protein